MRPCWPSPSPSSPRSATLVVRTRRSKVLLPAQQQVVGRKQATGTPPLGSLAVAAVARGPGSAAPLHPFRTPLSSFQRRLHLGHLAKAGSERPENTRTLGGARERQQQRHHCYSLPRCHAAPGLPLGLGGWRTREPPSLCPGCETRRYRALNSGPGSTTMPRVVAAAAHGHRPLRPSRILARSRSRRWLGRQHARARAGGQRMRPPDVLSLPLSLVLRPLLCGAVGAARHRWLYHALTQQPQTRSRRPRGPAGTSSRPVGSTRSCGR